MPPRIACNPGRCHAPLYDVTRHVAEVEGQLKPAMEPFNTCVERRTCRPCGDVQPEQAAIPPPPDRLGPMARAMPLAVAVGMYPERTAVPLVERPGLTGSRSAIVRHVDHASLLGCV